MENSDSIGQSCLSNNMSNDICKKTTTTTTPVANQAEKSSERSATVAKMSQTTTSVNKAKPTVLRGNRPANRSGASANAIPEDILNDPIIAQRIASKLPQNYSFEIHKSIWRIRKSSARRVCLQFPDGLFIFAVPIVSILREFNPTVEFVIMADTVYGACCIDDCKAKELDCDMLIHYGHSCLVPINQMASDVAILYVFVDIKFDIVHLIETVVAHFKPAEHRLCLAGTIQFVSSIHLAGRELRDKHGFTVQIPQAKPLTPGELLGCTSPELDLDAVNTILFVADGRFHLESLMIANPTVPAYKYNPYDKSITREHYDQDAMLSQRSSAVQTLVNVLRKPDSTIGLILGTLGRQGSVQVCKTLKKLISSVSDCTVVTFLISEISPEMLQKLTAGRIQAWIQIGCPRLSIDWGNQFVPGVPLLSPYEARTAVRTLQNASGPNFCRDGKYHMDFYSRDSLGSWTPSHKCHEKCECEK